MMGFNVVVKGAKQLARRLIETAEFAARPFNRKTAGLIQNSFTEEVERAMSSRGSSLGSPWPPLKPATIAEKTRNFPGRPDLVRTGSMASSLTNSADTQHLFKFARIRVILGSKDKVAAFHQIGAGNLPVRMVFAMNKKLGFKWASMLARDLNDTLKGITSGG